MKYINLLLFLLFLALFGCKNEKIDFYEDSNLQENFVQIEIKFDIEGKAVTTKNFYFILDASGSMSGDKIRIAKEAIFEFLKIVPEDANLGLFLFDSDVTKEMIPLGNQNRSKFVSVIKEVDAGGGTPLTESLETALESITLQYKKQLGYGNFRIIVVTDGEADNSSSFSRICSQISTYSFIDLYAIGFQVDGDHPLKRYSREYRSAESKGELTKALKGAVSESESFDSIDFDSL
ncbi:MAG: VWA domain-containing protein [Nanoarchaeota archaeon]|nr:VWA domain-containing protein [Nanoarchaeota archaeon]